MDDGPMRNRQTITRTAAVTTSALLAFALAACGGGSDDGSASDTGSEGGSTTEESPQPEAGGDDVCGATEALTEMSSAMSDIDPNDLQATMDKLEDLTSTIEAVDQPPAEIADDWDALSSSFRDVTDSLGAVVDDPSDSEAMSKVSESMATLSDESFQKSAQAISTYAAENC